MYAWRSARSTRCAAILAAFLVAMAICVPAEAQGGHGGGAGGGPGEEVTGNNLSYPVIFLGAPLALRVPTCGLDYCLEGQYWYGWIDPITGEQLACDPTVTGCPPPDVELSRIYLQKDPLSVWQADHLDNQVTAVADYVDWSDNLESTVWSASSVIRVETVPFATDATLLGFEMWWASGKGTDEVWGARTSDAETPVPVGYPYYPGYATIHSTCAWLTLQKLETGGGSQSSPPDTSAYTWDAAAHKWLNVGAQTTTVEPYTAEVNVGGKAIFGYNWMTRRQVMHEGETKDGWWRLTFSNTCGTIDFTATTQTTPPGLAVAAEEGGDPLFVPQIDPTLDVTYIDIWLKASKGGGGGGKGGGGGHS